ncbi:MAG: acetate--CoA ligase family protein [Planctomycetes bacterium]|nr:acetate--CoA ligase family protein [Planctomycetota bacterium]
MRLTEHDGKRLLALAGIRVPDGGWARDPDGVRRLAGSLRGAVAVKLQDPAPSRLKRGWVRRCIDARAAGEAASAILREGGSPSLGFRVERWREPEREFYAAVVSDPAARAPVLLFGAQGGRGVEEGAGVLRRVLSIRRGPAPEDLRACVAAADLSGRAADSLGKLLSSLWSVYRSHGAVLVEVNPLGLCGGDLVALDARVELDPDAREGAARFEPEVPADEDPLERVAGEIDRHDHRGVAHFLRVDWPSAARAGRTPIGLHCVGTGVSLTCMDELARHGFLPINFADTSGNPTASKICRVVRVIFAQESMAGYFFMTCVSSQQLAHTARGIAKAFLEMFPGSSGRPDRPCLFCFRGAWDEEAQGILRAHGVVGANVRVLGRESSERAAADAFAELFRGRTAAPFPPAHPLQEADLHEDRPGIVRFDVLSGGVISIDTEACVRCTSYACLRACRSPSDEPVLAVEGGRARLRITPEEARRGGCVECLACVLDCRLEGRDAIRVRLPLSAEGA